MKSPSGPVCFVSVKQTSFWFLSSVRMSSTFSPFSVNLMRAVAHRPPPDMLYMINHTLVIGSQKVCRVWSGLAECCCVFLCWTLFVCHGRSPCSETCKGWPACGNMHIISADVTSMSTFGDNLINVLYDDDANVVVDALLEIRNLKQPLWMVKDLTRTCFWNPDRFFGSWILTDTILKGPFWKW